MLPILADFQWSDLLSVKDYWFMIVGTALGTFAGWKLAVAQARADQRQKDAEAKTALIVALEDLINLSKRSAEEFKKGGQPNFPIDYQRASVLCRRVSQFRQEGLRKEIDDLLYQCSHFNSKLLVVNSTFMIALMEKERTGQAIPPLMTKYNEMMAKHAADIATDWAPKALAKLRSEQTSS